jgi:hypothetical protein
MSDSNTELINQIKSIISNIDSNRSQLVLFLNTHTTTLTVEQKKNINARIKQLEETKASLLDQLIPLYKTFENNVNVSNDTLNKQIFAQGIIADETIKTRRQREVLDAEKPDIVKLAGINSYYSKKYNSHKQIMKTIVLICIPIIILSILGNKGLVPNTIVVLLISAIIIFGVITIGYQIIDISNRDKMNFDAYNWNFNKSNAPEPTPQPVGGDGDINSPWNYPSMTCIGADCCTVGSTMWDESSKKCILDTSINK